MEIVLIIALGGFLVWWGYTQLNKNKTDESQPLDSATKEPEAPYKVEEPVQAPTVTVSEPVQEAAKPAAKKPRAKKPVEAAQSVPAKKTVRKPRSKA